MLYCGSAPDLLVHVASSAAAADVGEPQRIIPSLMLPAVLSQLEHFSTESQRTRLFTMLHVQSTSMRLLGRDMCGLDGWLILGSAAPSENPGAADSLR